jgi:ribosomal protein S18 acetylase RimI-like enzyme
MRVGRLPVVINVTVRQARRDRGDGEQFARYFDIAGEGLLRWMVGRRYVDIAGKAFLEPRHDLSYEHVWFAESQGVVAGMMSGYSAADHTRSRDGPLFRAAGVRSIRVVAAWLLAARLFNFMDRLPEGDWYLQTVAVGEEYRGAGIGSLLLDHAEHAASASGARRFALDVAVDNDSARRLYERRGMTIEATSPSVPFVPGGAVHRMTKLM